MITFDLEELLSLREQVSKLKAILDDHLRIGPVEEHEYFERLEKELARLKLLSQPPPGPPNVPKPPYPRDVA